jgi:hypothetical protein
VLADPNTLNEHVPARPATRRKGRVPMANPLNPSQPGGEAPKLHIDSDWKSQAQAERERLAKQEAEAKAKADAGAPGEGDIPAADFRGLMGMLASQALMYMGGIADPQTGKGIFDPVYAAHMIDMLGVLEEKTRGNLTDEESRELTGVIHELRSRFVQIMQMVAQQQQKMAGGGASPGAGPGVIVP